jgi:hypothetical protein
MVYRIKDMNRPGPPNSNHSGTNLSFNRPPFARETNPGLSMKALVSAVGLVKYVGDPIIIPSASNTLEIHSFATSSFTEHSRSWLAKHR